MGLEEEAPPLPPRLYTWSDVEDNDDELFQSDDDLDDLTATVTISDHQKIYSSVSLSPCILLLHRLFRSKLEINSVQEYTLMPEIFKVDKFCSCT